MSFHHIPLGKKSPEVVNVVVENPEGSPNKFEYDEEMDEIKLDRVLHSPMHFPANYCFIPQTRGEDGDHLDALVLTSTLMFPGVVVSTRVIGAIDMEDEAGQDWKILGVAEKDPRLSHIESVEDMGAHFKKEVEHFFKEYKTLEGKWMNIKGWLNKEAALRLIKEGAERFAKEKH